MDNRKKRLNIYLTVTTILLVVLFFCAHAILGNYKTFNEIAVNKTAADLSNLGEMLLEGYDEDTTGQGKVFDKEVFWKLISQISGEKEPNKDTLNGLTSTKTSADLRTLNGGSDVTVVINGIPWTATYLSANEKGEPVLTLWQADSIEFNYYNASTNAMVDNVMTATFNTSENAIDSLTKYPSNSYGTSFIATSVLNNGGEWARTGSATETVEQNENSTYAKFTMDNVKGSLTQFIDAPNDMPFQKNASLESAKTYSFYSDCQYDTNNDVLGAPIAGNMYSPTLTYYTNSTVDRDGYLAWGDDKIWLPSVAEVGYGADGGDTSGLWKTSKNQRKITSGPAKSTRLRSAQIGRAHV